MIPELFWSKLSEINSKPDWCLFHCLRIELASRQLVFGKRTSIYAHLADHLPCGKETLIKRAKKLRENQQDDQLKLPIQHLKEGEQCSHLVCTKKQWNPSLCSDQFQTEIRQYLLWLILS